MFCPGPHSILSSHGCLLAASALVPFNCLTRVRKIAAVAWEREQGSCSKEGADVKWLQERVTLEEIPFSLKSNTPYDLTKKHSVSSALT